MAILVGKLRGPCSPRLFLDYGKLLTVCGCVAAERFVRLSHACGNGVLSGAAHSTSCWCTGSRNDSIFAVSTLEPLAGSYLLGIIKHMRRRIITQHGKGAASARSLGVSRHSSRFRATGSPQRGEGTAHQCGLTCLGLSYRDAKPCRRGRETAAD